MCALTRRRLVVCTNQEEVGHVCTNQEEVGCVCTNQEEVGCVY